MASEDSARVSLASVYTPSWHPTHTSPRSCSPLFFSTRSSLRPRAINTACSELHSAMLWLPFVLFKETVLCALKQSWPRWTARAFNGNISCPSTGISRTQTQRVGVATDSTHPVSRTPASQGVRTSPETRVVRELRAMSPQLSRPVVPICILSSFIFALLQTSSYPSLSLGPFLYLPYTVTLSEYTTVETHTWHYPDDTFMPTPGKN